MAGQQDAEEREGEDCWRVGVILGKRGRGGVAQQTIKAKHGCCSVQIRSASVKVGVAVGLAIVKVRA